MKRFLIKCLVFLFGFVVASYGLSWVYKKTILSYHQYQIKDKQYEERGKSAKTLLLGDSHVHRALKSSLIPSSFNFAQVGESYAQTYYKLLGLVEGGHKPERIVLNLDPHSFAEFRETRIMEDPYWVKRMDYLSFWRASGEKKILRKWLKGKHMPYLGASQKFSDLIKSRIRGNMMDFKMGWAPSDRVFMDQPAFKVNAKKRVNTFFSNQDLYTPSLVKYLEDLLNFCETEAIEVYLVKLPLHWSYLEVLPKYLDLEKYDGWCKRWENYSAVKGIFNFRNTLKDCEACFLDSDHLNSKGAEIITKKLKRELQI